MTHPSGVYKALFDAALDEFTKKYAVVRSVLQNG